jgi:lipopolysaccharide heptosyltransferase I
MTRLLVVRLGSLGDLVHALPAVAAIRRAHPEVAIDWLVDAVHRDFLALVPILEDVVTLEGRTARAWLDVRTRLRTRSYDVAIDFQGLLKSAALARLSGAARVLGFDRAALRESTAAPFYTEQVTVGEGRHVIEKNLRLAAALGAAAGPLEFPIRAVDSPAIRAFVADRGPFALLNGGAAWPNKRWPADRIGRLAAWLRDTHDLGSVILWGPDESALAHDIAAASDGAAVVAPPTALPDLVALARAARLMVSGDTGPTHMAAAVGTPVVALFGPTDARRNGPWAADDIAISRYDACDCHYERRCRRDAAHWCLGTISEADVRRAIATRLAGGAASGAEC